MPTSGIGSFVAQTMTRSGIARLPAHLGVKYDVEVAQVSELDVGVYRVVRADGPDWVARVFPASRSLADAQGDAAILIALERAAFPAERCAHPDPVSVLDGQSVLVTEFVPGDRPRGNGRTYAILGALLGRLHARPGSAVRPGGGWHHLVMQGTCTDEIAAAKSVLATLESERRPANPAAFTVLHDALDQAAAAVTLPETFVHPDFVPVNAVAGPEGELTVLDWTGAGRGIRVFSLGFTLWAAGARDLRLVDAFVSRYRRHVSLTGPELDVLPTAISFRPLTMDCWSLAMGRNEPATAAWNWPATAQQASLIADRARRAFETG